MASAEQVVHDFRRTPRADGHSDSTRQALRDALQSVDRLDNLALLLGTPGPLIVGPPAQVYEQSER